jgi:integrase
MTIPLGHRFAATQALRQVLARAVVWGMIDVNPAKRGVDNPQRRRTEKRPFESWAELEAIAARLGPRYGPMVIFAAATGLRPGEWIALERRDIDLDERVAYIRRAFTKGRLKCTKTEASVRAVPLQAVALAARSNEHHLTRARRWSFPRHAAATSTSITSAPDSGSPPSSPQGLSRSAGSTICDTPLPPLPCVPASPPSTSRDTWAPA